MSLSHTKDPALATNTVTKLSRAKLSCKASVTGIEECKDPSARAGVGALLPLMRLSLVREGC